jgi:hypothetical protein
MANITTLPFTATLTPHEQQVNAAINALVDVWVFRNIPSAVAELETAPPGGEYGDVLDEAADLLHDGFPAGIGDALNLLWSIQGENMALIDKIQDRVKRLA